MKKYIALVFFVFLTKNLANAQNTNCFIRGRLMSEGKAVEFLNVVLTNTSFGTNTDTLGNFELKNIPQGNYQMKISGVGYKTHQQSIKLANFQTLTLHIEIEPDNAMLKEIVITGTLKEIELLESPVSVEVFRPAFFKKNPTTCLFDALQNVNGVRPQLNCNVCNTGDIHINGMEGAYTMVMIDGMPIVSSLSTVYGLMGIPNSMVERVEIVKGPASTLYGSEAVAGLINIITKNPAKAPALSLDIFATNYGDYSADMAAKFRLGKRSSTLLSGNYYNFQKIWDKNEDGFTDLTLQNRISVFNKWNFERKAKRLASLAIRYMYEDRWGGQTDWTPAFRGGDEIYAESIYTKRWELIGAYQLPIRNEKFLLNYSINDHQQNSVYGAVSYIADQKVAFGQLTWDKKSGKHDLLFGTALRYTYYDDNTPATANLDNENQADEIFLPGLFLQDELKLSDLHKVLLGLRYDYHSRQGNIFTPRLAYKWTPNNNNIFRFNAGRGFRVVNLFTEDHAALTGARQVEILENLKPEQSWNFNFNYQKFMQTGLGDITLDGALFYTYFSNKIVADYLSNPDKIIYDNLKGYAISKGFSLNVDFNFDFPLKVLTGFTLMDVFQIEKDSLGLNLKTPQLQASDFSGTFSATYTFQKLNLSIDWTGNIYSPMYLPVLENDFRSEKSPWFSLQNIQLSKKIHKGLEMYMGIKNIFNFVPKNPILHPDDPFDKPGGKYFLASGNPNPVTNPNAYTFDPNYNYAPIQGIRVFVGIRYNFIK